MTGSSVLTNKIESEIELLQRHVRMLKAIMDNEPIGIIRLSELRRGSPSTKCGTPCAYWSRKASYARPLTGQ